MRPFPVLPGRSCDQSRNYRGCKKPNKQRTCQQAPPHPAHRKPDCARKVTFLETAAETRGKFTLVQVELAPGGGNDLHFHKTFDETFTAVEGTLGIQVGLDFLELQPGESATATVGMLHRFQSVTDRKSGIQCAGTTWKRRF
ncbi:MAG: cupin domain-containing protein [Lewinellaceae bacterium]|nr:cupin domain-containing protein [Lewinellaceae bacterium]